jgi:hypothetical protein
MDMGDAETRARVWTALGNQPGVSAWFAIWLLARFVGTAVSRLTPASKPAAPLSRDSEQICVGH